MKNEGCNMTKYRKKPIVIEAIKFEYTKEGLAILDKFLGADLLCVRKERYLGAVGEAIIKTLEDGKGFDGRHVATEGDYIIRGIKGEHYPCKPDIFKETYEEA